MMNTLGTIKGIGGPLRLLALITLCLLHVHCGNDDGGAPQTGYFAKTIALGIAGSGMQFDLEYDATNRIKREIITMGTDINQFEYLYNNAGLISSVLWNGTLFAHYQYDYSGILTKVETYDSSSGSNLEYPVSHSDGTYSIPGLVPEIKVDRRGQLLHHPGLDLIVTHTEGPGVHGQLSPQPARYFGDIAAFCYYDLTFSQNAVASIVLRGTLYEARYTRDGNNNITSMELVEGSTGALYQVWEITYEERSL